MLMVRLRQFAEPKACRSVDFKVYGSCGETDIKLRFKEPPIRWLLSLRPPPSDDLTVSADRPMNVYVDDECRENAGVDA